MVDYNKTPSFYNNDNVFEKYLGKTSYYLALQNSVLKLSKMINPDNILELGSGMGHTTIQLHKKLEDTNIIAIDNRKNVIEKSKEKIQSENIQFKCKDMVSTVNNINSMPELTIMLYSFHHIKDPINKKVLFLKSCYEKMDKSDYICIADVFLPNDGTQSVSSLWKRRSLEGYASTFWRSLDSLSKKDINKSKDIGDFSKNHELEAGYNVKYRNNEYLITKEWLVNTSRKMGFKIIISEPCNAFNDYVILMQK